MRPPWDSSTEGACVLEHASGIARIPEPWVHEALPYSTYLETWGR